MIKWLIIFGVIYLGILTSLALISRRKIKSVDDFMMGGFNIGSYLGFMTFAATLFSTFTLMGMPDFFRTHGVGAWIFLAVSDSVMVFLILWFGLYLRRKARKREFQGMSGLLSTCYGTKWAGYVYFLGAFLFLVPYVSIQIRGISIFLDAAFNEALPAYGWAILILFIMILYSETGGLKAIMFSDVLQGTLLMAVVWIMASSFVVRLGGVEEMFEKVRISNEALLSTPGPQGLFTTQFLIASLIAIVMIPVTQPQLATRLIIMRNQSSMNRMAVAVGCFAILIILPTAVIGMYGVVNYADYSTSDFLSQALLYDHLEIIAVITIIGLIAAAISTSDSQIFALSGELRSLLKGDRKRVMFKTRLGMIGFAVTALVFSLISSDQLVLLARVSFAGTALMGPMIMAAVLSERKLSTFIIWATLTGLVIFLLSLIGIIPPVIGGVRMDLLLFVILGIVALVNVFSSPVVKTKIDE